MLVVVVSWQRLKHLANVTNCPYSLQQNMHLQGAKHGMSLVRNKRKKLNSQLARIWIQKRVEHVFRAC
jgi:hypothetical protein